MTENLDQLRQVAEQVKHLTWELDGFSDGDDYVRLTLFGNDEKSLVIADLINDNDHAHYLNAVRPSAVLALIDRVEAAEAAVQRVREVCESSAFDCTTRDWGDLEAVTTDDVLTALDGGEQE